MKFIAFLLLVSVSASGFSRTLEEIKKSKTIRIAVDAASPPFNYYKGKDLVGFEVDLAKRIAADLGVKVEWVVQPFNTLLISLDREIFDLISTSHAITPERQKAADFTAPHYCTGAMVIAKAGGPLTEKELSGKKVSVPVGTVYQQYLEKNKKIEVKSFPTETDALQALLMDRVDAWVSDEMVALEGVKAHKDKSLVAGAVLFPQRNAMVVRKGNESLRNYVDGELKRFLSDGTYAKLSQQYFERDIRCK